MTRSHLLGQILVYFLHQAVTACLRAKEQRRMSQHENTLTMYTNHNTEITLVNTMNTSDPNTKMLRKNTEKTLIAFGNWANSWDLHAY